MVGVLMYNNEVEFQAWSWGLESIIYSLVMYFLRFACNESRQSVRECMYVDSEDTGCGISRGWPKCCCST